MGPRTGCSPACLATSVVRRGPARAEIRPDTRARSASSPSQRDRRDRRCAGHLIGPRRGREQRRSRTTRLSTRIQARARRRSGRPPESAPGRSSSARRILEVGSRRRTGCVHGAAPHLSATCRAKRSARRSWWTERSSPRPGSRAGIDMALRLVQKLAGDEMSRAVSSRSSTIREAALRRRLAGQGARSGGRQTRCGASSRTARAAAAAAPSAWPAARASARRCRRRLARGQLRRARARRPVLLWPRCAAVSVRAPHGCAAQTAARLLVLADALRLPRIASAHPARPGAALSRIQGMPAAPPAISRRKTSVVPRARSEVRSSARRAAATSRRRPPSEGDRRSVTLRWRDRPEAPTGLAGRKLAVRRLRRDLEDRCARVRRRARRRT